MATVAQELGDLVYAPDLEPHTGAFVRQPTIELTLFSGLEFEGVDGGNTRFLECAFQNTVFNGGSLRRARFTEVWMSAIRILAVDLAETVWNDFTLLKSSVAGLEAYGSTLRRVVLQDCKLDSLNLREAELADVEFAGCVLRDVDLMGATLKNVRFPGSTIERMDLTGATLKNVDLSEARDLELTSGGESLRGATISATQLMAMAGGFAQALGITVRD